MHTAIIVDDEKLVKQSLRKLLEDSGMFAVAGEAVNGLEALQLVKDLKPDLIITDIRMPVMNGLYFIEEVVKLHARTEIIIISGYDEFDYAQQAISLGVKEYILKPVKPVKFFESIKRVYERCEAVGMSIRKQVEQLKLCRNFAVSLSELIWTINESGIKFKMDEIREYCITGKYEDISNREFFIELAALLDEEWNLKANGQSPAYSFLSLSFTGLLDANMDIFYGNIKKMVDAHSVKYNWSIGKIVKNSMEYIKGHYGNQTLSLQTAAEFVGISPAYLSRAFIEETGLNFIRYLTDIRIGEAKRLLGSPNNKVYEVASKVGYSEYPHFARVFKKYTGLSPSEYRQRIVMTADVDF